VSVGIWNEPNGALLAQAPLLYVSPAQINAILPSSIPAGSYSLGVSGATPVLGSPSFTVWLPVTVIDGRFAAFTRTARGFGPAAALQYGPAGDLSTNGLATPAAPGEVVSLWGTGLGALPSGSDADPPKAGILRSDVTVYVGGIPVRPDYAGRAPGFPGVDQINFTLPLGVTPRCFLPLQIETGNATSGLVTLAVSRPGAVCGGDLTLPQSMLESLDAGGKLRGARLLFTSQTPGACLRFPQACATPTDAVAQTESTVVGAWDESDLSILVGPGTALPLPLCTRSDQAVPAAAIVELPGPMPRISGVSGCNWVNYYPGCIASGFSFGSDMGGISGSLPPPLPPGEVAGLLASYIGPSLTASWSAAPGPDDTLSVEVSSSYSTPEFFGKVGNTYTNTLSCEAPATARQFAFPAADATWALQYSQYRTVVLTLTNTTLQTFPLTGASYDFLLVNVVNSVSVSYQGAF